MAHFSKLGDILERFNPLEDKYISREFQKYGYELSEELDDLEHKGLYMKLAKELPRVLLENARNFVKDAGRVKSRPRLFMWKVTLLRKELKNAKTQKQKNSF